MTGDILRLKKKILTYSGSLKLKPEELIEWIIYLDKYFDYEEIVEVKQVMFFVTILKEHTTLWWDGIQEERTRNKRPR